MGSKLSVNLCKKGKHEKTTENTHVTRTGAKECKLCRKDRVMSLFCPDKVLKILEETGCSLAKVHEILGVSAATVYNWVSAQPEATKAVLKQFKVKTKIKYKTRYSRRRRSGFKYIDTPDSTLLPIGKFNVLWGCKSQIETV